MKAKFINEHDLNKILIPKSKDVILKNMENLNPLKKFHFELTRLCMDFWKNSGIVFNKSMSIDDFNNFLSTLNFYYIDYTIHTNNSPIGIVPLYALICQSGNGNTLYGSLVSKTEKQSNTILKMYSVMNPIDELGGGTIIFKCL